MFLTYLSLGVVLGLAITAGLSTINPTNCLIVFSGEQTVIKGCESISQLADVINALNNRLSFNI